ncbi:MAG: low molecular weight phosphotyrosine protein phosphatase [Planctomycetes bacterium]|nr:low molecular weight phosphotyrosine protein phosphatase [Planctomycetota bacterium]
MSENQTGVLFVCLGNICRSPLAKALFIDHARRANRLDQFRIDSCGLGGWHAGGPADPRTVQIAAANGIELVHTARQVHRGDATAFDLLIAMDQNNVRGLLELGMPAEKVKLMRSFDPSVRGPAPDVPDPYYGGEEGFRHMYEMLHRACGGLLAHLTSLRS